jgi:Protein of unknown function (DUF1064)
MARRFPVVPVELRTMDGIVFDSKTEMSRYAGLKVMERAGLIKDIERQPSFPVEINGHPYCTYTADFRYVDTGSGEVVIEDVKTTGTVKDPAYALRKKAAELFYDVEIIACDKHGVPLKRRKSKAKRKRK